MILIKAANANVRAKEVRLPRTTCTVDYQYPPDVVAVAKAFDRGAVAP